MLVRVGRHLGGRPPIHPGVGDAPRPAPGHRPGHRGGVRTGVGQRLAPALGGTGLRAAQKRRAQLAGGRARGHHPRHIGAVHQPAGGDQRRPDIPTGAQQRVQRQALALRVGPATVAAGFLALQHDAVDAVVGQRQRLVTVGGGAHQGDAARPAGRHHRFGQAPEGPGKHRRARLQHGFELLAELRQRREIIRQRHAGLPIAGGQRLQGRPPFRIGGVPFGGNEEIDGEGVAARRAHALGGGHDGVAAQIAGAHRAEGAGAAGAGHDFSGGQAAGHRRLDQSVVLERHGASGVVTGQDFGCGRE